MFTRHQSDDFFLGVLTIKRKGVLLINVYFAAAFFCFALDKDTQKNYKIIGIVLSFPLVKKTRSKNYASELHVSMTLFDVDIFFACAFFTLNFSIAKKSIEIGQEKDVWIGSFGHNHMNLFGAKQSIIQTTHEKTF